jgi:hypothetical protein
MSRTNYIFIDYENVPHTVLDRIEGKPVKVALVLGQQQKVLPIPTVKLIQKCPAQVRLVETELNGKNALDFVLACEVGAEAERDPSGFFTIVSKDKGFDALLRHLKTRGVFGERCTSLDGVRVLMSPKERVAYVTQRLQATTAARPKKRSTLESHIGGMFGKALAPEEVMAMIDELIAAKLITVSEAGAVSYPSTGES